MTKTKYFLLLLVCTVTAFTSCSKKTDDFDSVAQFTKDTTAIRAFIIAKNIPAVKDAKTGLFYQIITPGTGSFVYQANSSVTVNYSGSLLDGSVFETSGGKPVQMDNLSQLIPAWVIGIPLVQPGGRIRLIVPSALGYGNRGGLPFPPNSILDFTVDVISAK
jgi:FKBP-type peptidyl-prolyl cis-trans isomerase FkpA